MIDAVLESGSGLILRLLDEAERQTSFPGIRDVLRLCAESLEVDGCILWQIAQGNEPLSERRLIAAAQYFRGEPDPFWHYISMRYWTGRQVVRGLSSRIVRHDEIVEAMDDGNEDDPDFDLIQRFHIRSFATIPIHRRGKPWGALNLYTRNDKLPLPEICLSASPVAQAIPFLVENIARQTGVALLNDIREELRGGRWDAREGFRPATQMRVPLQSIIDKIRLAFGALEVSIYLENQVGGERRLELAATHWPWPETEKMLRYRSGEGLTGYCFAEKRPVRIPDLARLRDNDQDNIGEQYPGIAPLLNFDVEEAASSIIPGRVPPISWLGVPIAEEKPIGVLRLCGLKSGPYYFTELHQELLILAADQIAEWIANRTRLATAHQENEWLRRLVKGVAGLNHRVHESLTSGKPQQQQRLLADALAVANQAIPDADSFSIRLADEKKEELRYTETMGRAWELGSKQEVEARRALVFPLKGPGEDSTGAHVFRSNKVLSVPDVARSRWRCFPFPETKSMVIAPVSSGNKVFGTMEVRSNRAEFFTEHSVQVMELLGRQVGLYLFLADRLQELWNARRVLNESLEQQRETFENLAHQLKTPVILAVRRSNRLHGSAARRSPELLAETTALRAICRRSEHVVHNIGVFADLAGGKQISVDPATLFSAALIERLRDTAKDHSLLLDPEDKITFYVDESSFDALNQVIVQVDPRLLDQMIGNLLENAIKYSFRQSQIVIRGGLTRRQQYFFISVANRGQQILPDEAKRLAERGSRLDRVLKKEGSGLGLYLVRELLHAHKGELEIQPTNSNGVTEVRLLLPCMGRSLQH